MGSEEIDSIELVPCEVSLPGGNIRILQPSDGAELPDDGPVEWAPLVPYWAVLWRSGVALARELAVARVDELRVVELGCGLAVPSLVAARGGAGVLATDGDPDALPLVERNAGDNGLDVATARMDWDDPAAVVERGPFDLVIAADVLYERSSVATLLSLLPRLGREAWLADPGRPAAEPFLEEARRRWAVTEDTRDGINLYRVRLS